MRRRFVLISGIVAVLVLGASLSTARARQLDKEQQAHARLVMARHDVIQSLARAQIDGITVPQLATVIADKRHLDASHAPMSFPVFGSERLAFYNRQVARYTRIRTRIRAIEHAAARNAYEEAARQLSYLARDLGAAGKISVDVGPASNENRVERAALQSSVTPLQFQNVRSAAVAARAALAKLVQRQRAAIRLLLAQAGGTPEGIYSLATQTASSTDPQLALLSLFTARSARYRSLLAQSTSDVRTQTGTDQAAVKALYVASLAEAIRSDYGRTVPQKFILVSTESQSASLYFNGSVVFSTPVTTGGPELPTDHGVFHIYLKASPFMFHSPWPPDSPFYYSPTPVNYWMPFDGGEGLHDASWRSNFGPGSNLAQTDLGGGRTILGTHGCVNLPADAAAFIWNWAPVGTAVVVV